MATFRSKELIKNGLEIVNDGIFIIRAIGSYNGVIDSSVCITKVSNVGGSKAKLHLEKSVSLVIPANTTIKRVELYEPIRDMIAYDDEFTPITITENSLYVVSLFDVEIG